jgi:hypothetical protein
MTSLDRRAVLRLVGGATLAAAAVAALPSSAAALPFAPSAGAVGPIPDLVEDAQVVVIDRGRRSRRRCWWERGRRVCRRQRWECWWRRGRRICGWR